MPFFEIYNKNMYIFGLWNKDSSEPFGLEKVACTRPKTKTKPHRSHQTQKLTTQKHTPETIHKFNPQPPKVQAPASKSSGPNPPNFWPETQKVQI